MDGRKLFSGLQTRPNTLELFKDRKKEIIFYFSILESFDNGDCILQTNDRQMLFRILKSNFLLMLYNLIESCISSGLNEIYNSINKNKYKYNELISQLQEVWYTYKLKELHKNNSPLDSYKKEISRLICSIINNDDIKLCKPTFFTQGNLDAKKIKELCDNYCIRYRVSDDRESLRMIKEKRQRLAHGHESFGDCSRDFALSDLKILRDDTLLFIENILKGMQDYYDNKKYLNTV